MSTDHDAKWMIDNVSENVRQSQLLREVMELIEALVEESGFERPLRFYQTLSASLSPMAATHRDAPMTDAEARKFGRTKMPFGEYMGSPVDEVPLERLAWYADQRWSDQLRRYLKSPRTMTEMEE